MNHPSKLPQTGSSIFSQMTALAAKEGAINLAQGFPGFEPDPRIFQYTTEAMHSGQNQYAPMPGLPAFNELLVHRVNRRLGTDLLPQRELTVTAGATQALYTAISTFVHPGDEVIVFDPSYDCYKPAIRVAGGRPVAIPLRAPDFLPDWDEVKDSINAKTRMIIVNSPHNPTGKVWPASAWDYLHQCTKDHDLIILSDEVYEHITFDGHQHHSVLSHSGLAPRALATSSFGKTFHITGWKMGYIAGAESLMKEYQKVHQFGIFCVFRPGQAGLYEYLKLHPEITDELGPFFREKRDILRTAFEQTPLQPLDCEGTYFQLYDYSAISSESDIDFARRMTREAGVATIPISVFYDHPPEDQQIVRVCFAKTDDTLRQAAMQWKSALGG